MIENCSWKFKFQCPRMWGSLRQTDDPNVRLCESCLEKVYLCNDKAQLQRIAAEGKCVAIVCFDDSELLGRVGEID